MPNKPFSFVDELKQASKAVSDAMEKYRSSHSTTGDTTSTPADSTKGTDHPVQDAVKHQADEMKNVMQSFNEKLKEMISNLGKPGNHVGFHLPELDKFSKLVTEPTLNLCTALSQAFAKYFSDLAAVTESVKQDVLKDKQEQKPADHQE
jgi:bifunctional pyridoxal-dependent enzyme with beta-cystathionase and maltose regulon repressor activities